MTIDRITAGERFVGFARRRWWLLVDAVVLAGAVVLIVGLTTTAAYPRATWPPRCAGTATHSGALADRVVTVPADARPYDVMVSLGGRTFGLDQAALIAVDRRARADELRQDGFVEGTDQSWSYEISAEMVDVRLMRFSSVLGADTFLTAEINRLATSYDPARELPGVPGSFYFEGATPHGDPAISYQGTHAGENVLSPVGWSVSYALACVGDTVVIAYLWESGADPARARTVMTEQYARLT